MNFAIPILTGLLLPAISAPEPPPDVVRIEKLRVGKEEILLAHNTSPTPVTVIAFLTSAQNVRMAWAWSDVPGVVAMPGSKVLLGRLGPSAAGEPWNYEYSFSWTIGSMFAAQDPDVLYRLPLRVPSLCLQSFGDGELHKGRDHHSIDLRCPTGTAVHSARAGLVVDLREDSTQGGDDERFRAEANYVRILHADGTVGSYLHLRRDGVAVEVGQRVATGQLIAHSGNTGYSAEPHLHFMVTRADPRDGWRSLAIGFQGKKGPFVPAKGAVVEPGT